MTATGNKSSKNLKPSLTAKDREWMAAGKSKGPDRLTPTQRSLISNIASHQVGDGFVAISKREMAMHLGKCEKTIDRVVSDLRKRGLVETSSRYGAGGGQIANAYRDTSVAREKYPALVR